MNSECSGPSCSICGCPLIVFAIQKGEGYSVCCCKSCGVGWTVPAPDDVALHELHSTQYYRNGEGERFAGPIEWLVNGMRLWRIRRLTRFVNMGRALDIGCGSGRFLRALRNSGWEVAGLELNDDTATAARNVHGLVVETSLEVFADNSFDLITITHVLEHIRDPFQMLAECLRLLTPGGVIAVAVPNIESLQARLMRENWFHLDLPRHLWHFSESWLTNILCELGFKPLTVRRLDLAHNIFGWLQSLLNCLGLRHNRLYAFLSNNELETESQTHYVSLVLSLALVPLLFPVSVVLAVTETLLHAGGTVEIIAKRSVIDHSTEGLLI